MPNEPVKWSMLTGGKSYGPYTVEQLSQFIREGRANADSQVCPEGGALWARLADALPDLFAGTPPSPPVITGAAPKKKRGAGWITCLIVGAGCLIAVPFIGIVAAIAIPALVRARMAAGETVAIGSMRSLMAAEAVWRQNDTDGNGIPDYWTADVYGLYACADSAGQPMKTVDAALANADRFPSSDPGVSGRRPYYTAPPQPRPLAKSGFLFEALGKDPQGKPYALDGDGDGKACENPEKFGFRASRETPGAGGGRIYQMSEEGVIYWREGGRHAMPFRANWEGGEDPTAAMPSWRVVQ